MAERTKSDVSPAFSRIGRRFALGAEVHAAGLQGAHGLGEVGVGAFFVGVPAAGDAVPLVGGERLVLVALPVGLGGVTRANEFETRVGLTAVVDEGGAAVIADELVLGVEDLVHLVGLQVAGATDRAGGGAWLCGRRGRLSSLGLTRRRAHGRRSEGRRGRRSGHCDLGGRSIGQRRQTGAAVGAEVAARGLAGMCSSCSISGGRSLWTVSQRRW